ncbi:CcdB family protein [Azospirillum argentinense]
MRFLDVCRNPNAVGRPDHPVPFLLVVQGNHVAVRSTRVVIPLVRASEAGTPIRDVMPVLDVQGEQLVAMTSQIAGIPVTDIGDVVMNMSSRHHDIRRAIDVLTGDL